MPRLFDVVKYLSFFSSAAFACLLVVWIAPGLKAPTTVFGWVHGWTWIVMAILGTIAVRRRAIPLWLGVLVVVIGAVGPFFGSVGFVWEERRKRRQGV